MPPNVHPCPDADTWFVMVQASSPQKLPPAVVARWGTYTCDEKRMIAYNPMGPIFGGELVELRRALRGAGFHSAADLVTNEIRRLF